MMRCSSSSVAALLGAHTRIRGLRARLGNVRLSPDDTLSLQLSLQQTPHIVNVRYSVEQLLQSQSFSCHHAKA